MFGYRKRRAAERQREAIAREMHEDLARRLEYREDRHCYPELPPKVIDLFNSPHSHAGTFRRMDSHDELDAHMAAGAWLTTTWRGQTYMSVAGPDPSKLQLLDDPNSLPEHVRTGWVGGRIHDVVHRGGPGLETVRPGASNPLRR